MATKRCPGCGLVNPGSALRCDCGLSFETMMRDDGTHASEPAIVTPKQSVNQVAKVVLIASVVCFVAAFLVVGPSHNSKFGLEVGAGLGVVGLMGLSLARVLWRTGRGMYDD